MRYRDMPLGRQILLPAMFVLIVVFALMIGVSAWLTERAAMAQAQLELGNEVKLVVGGLDSEFDSVKARGARQLRFFEQFLGGAVRRGEGMHKTGDLELPTLTVNGALLNANHEPLERFKALTTEESAILVLHQGKVHRLSTLLKRDGKPMDGTALADSDPVTKALLAGEDYQGLVVRNGKYYFSNIRALKDSQGKVFAGLSVRIELDDVLTRLRALYGSVVAGKTGYVTIVRPSGDDKTIGEFIVHPKFQGKVIGEVVGDGRARHLHLWLQRLIEQYADSILVVDTETALAAGTLDGAMRARGPNGQLADILIAATAQTHGLTVVTANTRDFEPLGVDCLAPF